MNDRDERMWPCFYRAHDVNLYSSPKINSLFLTSVHLFTRFTPRTLNETLIRGVGLFFFFSLYELSYLIFNSHLLQLKTHQNKHLHNIHRRADMYLFDSSKSFLALERNHR